MTDFFVDSLGVAYQTNGSFSAQLEPYYHVDLVLGYEIVPSLLPFVQGGVTFADSKVHADYSLVNVTTGTVAAANTLNLNKYNTGFNVGIGANWLPAQNWMLGGELVYDYFGKNTRNTEIGNLTTLTSQNQGLSVSMNASYLFNL